MYNIYITYTLNNRKVKVKVKVKVNVSSIIIKSYISQL